MKWTVINRRHAHHHSCNYSNCVCLFHKWFNIIIIYLSECQLRSCHILIVNRWLSSYMIHFQGTFITVNMKQNRAHTRTWCTVGTSRVQHSATLCPRGPHSLSLANTHTYTGKRAVAVHISVFLMIEKPEMYTPSDVDTQHAHKNSPMFSALCVFCVCCCLDVFVFSVSIRLRMTLSWKIISVIIMDATKGISGEYIFNFVCALCECVVLSSRWMTQTHT